MSASQQSRFSNFLLADTFGPLKFKDSQTDDTEDDDSVLDSDVNDLRQTTRNYYGNGNVNPVYMVGSGDPERISTQSSLAELSAAQEVGQRTTFREQSWKSSNDGKEDEESLEHALKTAAVHIRGVHGDIENDTPASTASSTQRFFLSKSGKPRDFNVGNMQKNHLDITMRDVLRDAEKKEAAGTRNFNEMNEAKSYPGEIKDGSIQGDYWNKTKEKKTWCCLKFFIFVIALAALLGGIFVTVYFLKANSPQKATGKLIVTEKPEVEVKETCKPVNVSLRDPILIKCNLKNSWFLQPAVLKMTPPPYLNRGEPIVLNIETQAMNMSWSAVYDSLKTKLTVYGPAAICSSTGDYQLELFNSKNQSIYSTSVKVNVISEVLKVNVSLTQSLNDSAFKIACKTNSGCEQSFVDFFAEINKEEQFLRGVNFSCMINYNDYDGYSVSCTGKIPDFLMSQFERITCRPRSTLLDDLDEDEIKDLEEYLELPDCDIATHCGFECDSDGDYYLVNSGRCDIFHRCFKREVYTSYCAPGTFFDPGVCACRHTRDLSWCQDNGAVRSGADASRTTCSTEL